MSTAPDRRNVSLQEYLSWEDRSETKHEYYRGEIFAMAGASFVHNRIFSNVFARLAQALEGTPCEVFGSDLRIRIDAVDLTTYPDISVVCGGAQLHSIDRHAITNPRLIVEILSKSTENYDRGPKFELYQNLESLGEYVVVYQSQPRVIHYVRQENGTWRYRLLIGLEASLEMESFAGSIPFSNIYRNVEFKANSEEPSSKLPRPAE